MRLAILREMPYCWAKPQDDDITNVASYAVNRSWWQGTTVVVTSLMHVRVGGRSH